MKQNEKEQDGHFKTKAREITNGHDIAETISDAGNTFLKRISDRISKSSGGSLNLLTSMY